MSYLSVSRFSGVYVSQRFQECIPGRNGWHLMEDMVPLLVGYTLLLVCVYLIGGKNTPYASSGYAFHEGKIYLT